ncbi:hypothetical protein SAMN05661091_4107 [Paenibacillus uliginis N3/975]|uniref:Uncharacterized protein n=1 Tax=Paenibacillus uliginis N3/975 TaxID=1313296 RepID=A0A1X7HK03_9BACL|nr:hypothetical protein SAMN05661091_4107 [Paenibacillus uliginis N3/975]
MTQINEIPVEVMSHYNNLHIFSESGLVNPAKIDFVLMEIAMIERDFPRIRESQ